METVVVYSANNSNRLRYVLDWLFRERLHINYRITQQEQELTHLPFFISYGAFSQKGISIPDAGLLFEKDIHSLEPSTGLWQEIPVLFTNSESAYTLPFDLFSALFYVISRYEEYLPYKPDKHGRYPATSSFIYKKGWLQRPLADEWIAAFCKLLQAAAPDLRIEAPRFHFQPTYDIDMAYSHLYKGFSRIAGAYLRALLRGDVRQINERTRVLKYKQKDPYDSFRWLRQLHKEYDCKPIYFVLAATRTTRFDKNIPPRHPAMMRVIRNLVKEGAVGSHPSYYSEQGDLMLQEKKLLEEIGGKASSLSRQHYIKFRLPDTPRLLIKNEITEDFSMGYGTHIGFRAGTGNSFLWFDLPNDSVTGLRLYPFCFMDTTARYEARMPVADAFVKLSAMSQILERTGSTLITVFHNFSLGTANEWKGWRQAYEQFLMEKSKV